MKILKEEWTIETWIKSHKGLIFVSLALIFTISICYSFIMIPKELKGGVMVRLNELAEKQIEIEISIYNKNREIKEEINDLAEKQKEMKRIQVEIMHIINKYTKSKIFF